MMDKIDDDVSNSSNCSESDENENSSEDFANELLKIDEYRLNIKKNSDDYDSHFSLIKALRFSGDIESARLAREQMNIQYPLSPEMWLEWINDEIAHNSDKSDIYKLLQRATEDYCSVDVYFELCQFSIGYFTDNVEIRRIFEEAINRVGKHFSRGYLLFSTWIVYESQILMGGLQGEEATEQRDRVFNLYKRQLSAPLEANNIAWEEFSQWNKDWHYGEEEIRSKFEESVKMVECLQQFEDAVINGDVDYVSKKISDGQSSKEEAWLNYLKFAEENINKVGEDDKIRIFVSKLDIINLYERAITDICLSQSIWANYLRYLAKNFETDSERILTTCKRAVRNNKTSLELRLLLTRNMERFSCDATEIRAAFSETLRASLADKSPFLPLWQSYLDFERRQLSSETKDLTIIRQLFERLVAIDNYLDYDPCCVLVKYWAFIEARYGSNVERSRELWAMVRKSLGTASTALWLENVEFERRFGDFDSCKRVLSSAVNSFVDYPEYLFERVLRIVAEEGDIDSYFVFLKKIDFQQIRINEKNQKEAQLKKQENPDRKLKRQSDDKKVAGTSQVKKQKVFENVKESPKVSLKTATHTVDKVGPIVYSEERSVFVSNLSYKVSENELRETFGKCGELEDIRLSRLENGKSRGFAYIQYKDKGDVEEALKLEHSVLMERPMFVNRCDPNKRHSFNYVVGETEKNKLFVKNLPKTITKQALNEIFNKFGSLRDVRLVTLRNGVSKGIAYVEFSDEDSASKALVGTDGMLVGDKAIEVLLSKTPQKDGGSSEGAPVGVRGDEGKAGGSRGRTDTFLVPRAVHRVPPSTQKKVIHQSTVNIAPTEISSTKKSNEDFRKFLG